MIKKSTKAIFKNGDYSGTYDWEGGVPLSLGETVNININKTENIVYALTNKEVTIYDEEQNQLVKVVYTFEIVKK